MSGRMLEFGVEELNVAHRLHAALVHSHQDCVVVTTSAPLGMESVATHRVSVTYQGEANLAKETNIEVLAYRLTPTAEFLWARSIEESGT